MSFGDCLGRVVASCHGSCRQCRGQEERQKRFEPHLWEGFRVKSLGFRGGGEVCGLAVGVHFREASYMLDGLELVER